MIFLMQGMDIIVMNDDFFMLDIRLLRVLYVFLDDEYIQLLVSNG